MVMSESSDPAIAILAGGQSRRMGREKAAITFRGESLLQRMARTALECSSRVWVIGCEQPQSWTLADVRFVDDDEPALGPMGGLATALRVADGAVLAVACDMPKLDAPAIRWLLALCDASTARHGVITRQGELIEPLFACYRPQVAELIDEQLQGGNAALRDLIAAGEFDRVEVPDESSHWLLNVNRPEDLAALVTP